MRIGIIGCGRIAVNTHAPAFRRLGLPIVAVADVDPLRMKAFGSDVKKFIDYHQLLDEKLDLVSICTPDGLHAEMCVAAAKASTDILLEKPAATTLKDCERMRQAVRKSGVQLCMVHNLRFFEPFQAIKKYIIAGRLGKILSASMTWHSDRKLGSSVAVHDVHLFYMLEWLFGQPRWVSGRSTKNVMNGQFIYNSHIVNTALSQFSQSKKHVFSIDVYGSSFFIQARDPPNLHVGGYNIRTDLRMTLGSSIHHAWRLARLLMLLRHRPWSYKSLDSHFLLIRDYIARLEAGREPPVDLDEGIRAVNYALTFEKACERNKMLSIEDA